MILSLENYQAGMDRRRGPLTSGLGSLYNLRDCFVNAGGEIEKRKAFVPTSISMGTSYGFQIASTKLYIFGGGTNPGGWPEIAGLQVTYQRLQVTYASGLVASASAVVHSALFNDLPFVIATMDDTSTQVFYNGTAVTDFYYGKVAPGALGSGSMTNAQFLAMMAEAVSATSLYTGTVPSANNLTIQSTVVDEEFTLDVTETLTPSVTPSITGHAVVITPAQPASCSFEIVAGTENTGVGISNVELINPADPGNPSTLVSAAIAFDNNVEDTAKAVAANINAYAISAGTGVKATSLKGAVIIQSASESDTMNGYVLRVTSSHVDTASIGNCIVGRGLITLSSTGVTVNAITASALASGGSSKELLGTTYTYPGAYASWEAFVLALASAINARTNATPTKFNACAVGTNLYVGRLVTRSDDSALEILVDMTTTTGKVTMTRNPSGQLSVGVAPSSLSLVKTGAVNRGNIHVDSTAGAVVGAAGGTPPYSYLWRIVKGPAAKGFMGITSPRGTLAKISGYVPTGTTAVDQTMVCDVKDSKGVKVTTDSIPLNLIV